MLDVDRLRGPPREDEDEVDQDERLRHSETMTTIKMDCNEKVYRGSSSSVSAIAQKECFNYT